MIIVKNNLIPLVSSAVLFSLITACGGGLESNKTSAITKDQQPPQPYQITQQQPHKPLDKQLRKAYKLSSNTDSALTVTSNENSIIITYTADNITIDIQVLNFQKA
jgi:hypothetical protein